MAMTSDWIDDVIADLGEQWHGLDSLKPAQIRAAIENNQPTIPTHKPERRHAPPWVDMLLRESVSHAHHIAHPGEPRRIALTVDELRALIMRYAPIERPALIPWTQRLWDELHLPNRLTTVGHRQEFGLTITYCELESALERVCPASVSQKQGESV